MNQRDNLVTYFSPAPEKETLPSQIPSPFALQPHPLAELASDMLKQRLQAEDFGARDFFVAGKGKMFGILVVSDQQGKIGFLSAFSGMMNGEWLFPGFVPPLFDYAEQARFLPLGKMELTALTQQLQTLETSPQRLNLKQQITHLEEHRDIVLATLKTRHKAAKAERKQQRLALQNMDESERQVQMRALALASQHHKREAADVAKQWQNKIQVLQNQLDVFEQQIQHIKDTRAETSRELHKQVFDAYILKNHDQKQQTLAAFFEDGKPPAGAGDCAAPKLLHYAFEHGLQPLALAEFWWGASHPANIRHHGFFYPSCRGKCRPILPFMLRGLNVEQEPSYGLGVDDAEPQLVYEDDVLFVINKPSGLMSTPGTDIKDSVFTRLLKRYPENPELRLVHRLDMDTSGLLLVAKNLRIHKLLQKQFIQRSIEKRYEALLSKVLPEQYNEGDINLPLRVDYYDRPRQMVCYEYGKSALTHWEVIKREAETTRVYFYPHTGRSHQLRMHAAHVDGLDAAIVGDDLYGKSGKRLMLHAQQLCFTHPVTRERLSFEVPAPF